LDKVDGGQTKTESNQAIGFTGETDRVYLDGGRNSNPIVINDRLRVTGSSTMPDVVVWNPWQDKAKASADIGEQNFPKFVCVEVGHVSGPVQLDKNQTWKGFHELTLLK
jgi:glucose-6-phosphate 1-epimerase